MNRRKYLSGIIASQLSIPLIRKSKQYSTEESDWCITTSTDTSALSFPNRDPDFVVSGSKDVNVYWVSQDFFDDRGYFFAYALAGINGNIIALNKAKKKDIDDYALLHELAHSLGYRHGDGGIVNTNVALFNNTGDRTGKSLEQSTKEVGNSFNSYTIYTEWDINSLGNLGSEFAADDLILSELGEAGKRFASTSSIEDLHIDNSHNGMGGMYNTGNKEDPRNIYAGRFYKSH
jgi:hypothetical protein